MNLAVRLPAWLIRLDPRPLRIFRRHLAIRRTRKLQPAVAEVRDTLLEFDSLTRGEFLQLSECLAPLSVQFTEIAAQATELDQLLQARNEDHAYVSAFDLYKRSVDLAHSSIGISLTQEEEMQCLEGSLLKNEHRLARNSLMFRTLVLSIRAEAMRVDAENQSVFISVATEMAAMEHSMREAVEAAFGELGAIVAEASTGRAELQRLQITLHENAQRSVGSLRSGLDELKSNLAPCATANERIVQLLTESQTHTTALITALQYQDIVRQQLEHVGSGFEDIASALAPAKRSAIDLGFLREAATVQQAQLNRSRRSIEAAGAEITRAGASLLNSGRELGIQFHEMEHTARAVLSGSTLGGLLRGETERLVAIASRSEATNARIARLLDRIEASVHTFTTEIRRYEIDVQFIALNAQIAAARVPHAGALNKLAEETARLAFETAQITHATTDQLGATLSRLHEMRRDADKVRDTIGREKAELATRTGTVSAKLAQLDERVRRGSTALTAQFERAYSGVEALLASLRFPNAIDGCYAPSEDFCTTLLATIATAPVSSAVRSDRLIEHNRRYTMREERETHALAVGGETPSSQDVDVELFVDGGSNTPASTEHASPQTRPEAEPATAGAVELF